MSEGNVLVLQALQKLFEVLIFSLGAQTLGFELSNFILQLGKWTTVKRGVEDRGCRTQTHIFYVLLLTLPKRSLCRTVLLLPFHQARLVLHGEINHSQRREMGTEHTCEGPDFRREGDFFAERELSGWGRDDD